MLSRLTCAVGVLCFSTMLSAKDHVSDGDGAAAARIKSLVQQLGHSDYAVREAAQDQLQRLDITAFDSLHEAQDSDDIEIRLRARYLVRSTKIAWATDDDPRPVRQALRDYQSQSEPNRLQRIVKVAELDAVAPLCRIARFESSEALSKCAALAIMQRKMKDEAQRLERSAMILKEIQQSRRRAADWLRLFVNVKDRVRNLNQWGTVVNDEIKLLNTAPEKTNRELAQSLAKWHADRLFDAGLPEEGVAAMRRVVDTHDDSSRFRLVQLADWLADRKAWELVIEEAERFSAVFRTEPLLLYRQAEAHLKIEQNDEAEDVATQAFKLPATRAIRGNVPYDTYVSRARFLEERGLMPWCKREYRQAIDESNVADYEGYYARFRLSEILHDEGDDKVAADALQEVLTAIGENVRARMMVKELLNRQTESIEARMHYFRAMHLAQIGKAEQSRGYLEMGLKSDPTDPDVLIAMYRSPDAPAEWRVKTIERIEKAAQLIQQRIATLESIDRDDDSELANACNHFAWLVSNTVGDYGEALKKSQRSLELIPGSPELTDTLARCHYAMKDYENAVKFQRQAYEKLAHSQQIRQQLELFEQAYRKSQTDSQ